MMTHTIQVEGEEIVIRVPLKGVKFDKLKMSASGKSRGIATTNGNVDLEGVAALIGAPVEAKIGLNIYAPIPKDQRK